MTRFALPLRSVLGTVVLAMLVSGHAEAQSRVSLKLSNVPGESAQRPGEIDVISFSIGVSRPPVGKSASDGLRIVKLVDKTTPKLAQCCMSGQVLSSAVLTVLASDGMPLLTYTLTDVQVVSLKTGTSVAGAGEAGGGADNSGQSPILLT